jgi:hypothetical protein
MDKLGLKQHKFWWIFVLPLFNENYSGLLIPDHRSGSKYSPLINDYFRRERRGTGVWRAARRGAWHLELRLGAKWLPVRSRREPVRHWRSLTAVGRFCKGVGIKALTVEL